MNAPAESPWAWDRHFVRALVDQHLGRFLGAIGAGTPIIRTPRPRWWRTCTLSAEARALHGLDLLDGALTCLLVQAEPGAMRLLVLDLAQDEWFDPAQDAAGDTLISLAARRWGISPTKAAWKWARACGYPIPRPA